VATFGAQWWRFFTAPIFHAGLLHILFNMMTLLQFGSTLERTLGSLPFFYLIGLFWLLLPTIVAVVGIPLYLFAGVEFFVAECGVGFSGILFALMVIDNSVNRVEKRSIFGLFQVPAAYYPIATLVFIQLLIPGVSLLGHGIGLLLGYAYTFGLLKWLIPRSDSFKRMEATTWLCCGICIRSRSYVTASSAVDSFGGVLPSSMRPSSSTSSTSTNPTANTPLRVFGGPPRPQNHPAPRRANSLSPSETGSSASATAAAARQLPAQPQPMDEESGFEVEHGRTSHGGYSRLLDIPDDVENPPPTPNRTATSQSSSSNSAQVASSSSSSSGERTPQQLAAAAALARLEKAKQQQQQNASQQQSPH
jgi:membrane associated rhomboid family serine protease